MMFAVLLLCALMCVACTTLWVVKIAQNEPSWMWFAAAVVEFAIGATILPGLVGVSS